MITYPNPKINIGLYITEKRDDGFHNLETIFYPIDNKKDKIEIKISTTGKTTLSVYPKNLTVHSEDNLCLRAYRLLEKDHKLPDLAIMLHKEIPTGAGLGGGSADAAFVLKMINEVARLHLNNDDLRNYAAKLGSDVPFFIENRPVFATGRGEIMEPVELDLSGKTITIVKPPFSISTAEAYSCIIPKKAPVDLREAIRQPIETWKDVISNDFEKPLFKKYPELEKIKQHLYDSGADYVAMSGSGSAIYAVGATHERQCKNRSKMF
ncbi:4-(cytidine 5'-diphospho)-2-C-methyl-D-erythritol kinase [Bacteroidales bacterium OttesenSCG-928-B11]|nr:4-(cytidine 5'-diphospho)-2-C-methyl-D-erythritol kinase [Bacteroidales bacterium OttesenSCG-928-E04]MDL2309427.1 4-(cytidine 5'-diphospho)-2-C-methyl-D-erythritol kinase [Bacteroidales bacterium OttesenSCG-928-C03]MDL2312617.1 4-(cytidine 5'-diphospho)-2-C-methyl-D-erythritol kinase [Bacteroidales bacterium OttesenSCG-928-B11]